MRHRSTGRSARSLRRRSARSHRPMSVFPFGVSLRLEQAVRELGVPVTVARELDEADAVVTLRNYCRKPSALRDAESHGCRSTCSNERSSRWRTCSPRSSTWRQPAGAALREAAEAIEWCEASGRPVGSPRRTPTCGGCSTRWPSATLSRSRGSEPNRRVELIPDDGAAGGERASRTDRPARDPRPRGAGARRALRPPAGVSPPPPERGRFITLEGPEGGGKTTAARHLGAWLQERGVPAIVTQEPGGTPLGDEVRRIVLHMRGMSDDLDTGRCAALRRRPRAARGACHPPRPRAWRGWSAPATSTRRWPTRAPATAVGDAPPPGIRDGRPAPRPHAPARCAGRCRACPHPPPRRVEPLRGHGGCRVLRASATRLPRPRAAAEPGRFEVIDRSGSEVEVRTQPSAPSSSTGFWGNARNALERRFLG